MVKFIRLLLFIPVFLMMLIGCSIPLKVNMVQTIPPTTLMNECLEIEPIWKGQALPKEYIEVMTKGFDNDWEGFKKYMIKSNPTLREDIIIDWINRSKERYEKLKNKKR